MRLIHLFTLAITFTPSLAHASRTQAREHVAFAISHLALDLGVDYERGTISGRAELHVINTSKTPEHRISLLVGRLMSVSRATSANGAPLHVRQGVATFVDDSSMQLNAVVVDAGHAIAPGDSFTLVMHYGGVLVGYVESGSLYIKDHIDREFTIIREDAFAFPRAGVLSHQLNRRALRPDFTFDARITMPKGGVVAAGGEPLPTVEHDSLVTWHYRSRTAVPFLNITIAPYKVIENTTARIYFFPQDSVGAAMMQTSIGGAVNSLGRRFGRLDHASQLVVMEIPEGYGSQSSLVAGIIQTADAFRDRGELRQVYHELTHLWNVTDRDVPSPRWNEGLASFLQWSLASELDGWDDWDARLNRSVGALLDGCTKSPSCQQIPMAQFGTAALTDRSYTLGMLMFFALHDVLGEDLFNRAYANFVTEHRQSGGTTQEMAHAFRAVSAKSEPILSDWLFTTRWYSRLSRGETFRQIVESYRR